MRQVRFMFLACAVTAALLSGCSSANQGTKGSTEAVTAVESATAETAAQAAKEGTTGPKDTVTGTKAEEKPSASRQASPLRVGSLKGPTTMGMVSLMDRASKGEAEGSYEFTMVTAADELVGQMVSGKLDIALTPANMASILYQKTNQGVCVIDVNTLGVLYIVTADASVGSMADLKGKTLYLTGKGTTPDYVLRYLLTANDLGKEDVTLEYKSEATEVAAVLKQQDNAIGLLPQPFATVAMAQNERLNMVMDLTEEWDQIQNAEGGRLVTGVTVCRKDLLDDADTKAAVDRFIKEHEESALFANDNPDETARLVAEAGIIEKAPVAKKALPYCSIVGIHGDTMKEILSGYLKVLYEQDPTSVGGTLPDDGFYYLP